ncbi:hypothetical protein DFH09DRAFT_1289106 [Mycena vulgaris]|nr:hypothetical protein DFH09DRAFT_1289106 [Mycena vulgaris]
MQLVVFLPNLYLTPIHVGLWLVALEQIEIVVFLNDCYRRRFQEVWMSGTAPPLETPQRELVHKLNHDEAGFNISAVGSDNLTRRASLLPHQDRSRLIDLAEQRPQSLVSRYYFIQSSQPLPREKVVARIPAMPSTAAARLRSLHPKKGVATGRARAHAYGRGEDISDEAELELATLSLVSSSHSKAGYDARMRPPCPRASPAPGETPEGGDGGDGREMKKNCTLSHRSVSSTIHVSLRGRAYRLRRPSRRRRFVRITHTGTPSYRSTRARAHPKDTQDTKDVEHDAALPHSLRRRWCARERSGIEGGCGCGVRRRARGGDEWRRAGSAGGEKETSVQRGMLRPLPAYPGVGVRSSRHPRHAPFWRALCVGMGGCTSVAIAGRRRARARGVRVRARRRRRAYFVPVDHSHGRARIHPTSHSHHARRRFHARLSLSLISDPSSSSPSTSDRWGGGTRVGRNADGRRAEPPPPVFPGMCGATPWASASSGNAGAFTRRRRTRASGAAASLLDETRGAGSGRAVAGAARAFIPARRGVRPKLRPQPDSYAALDSRRPLAPTHGRERRHNDDAAGCGASWCRVYWELISDELSDELDVSFPRPSIATTPTIITPPFASPLAFKHDGSLQGGPARQFLRDAQARTSKLPWLRSAPATARHAFTPRLRSRTRSSRHLRGSRNWIEGTARAHRVGMGWIHERGGGMRQQWRRCRRWTMALAAGEGGGTLQASRSSSTRGVRVGGGRGSWSAHVGEGRELGGEASAPGSRKALHEPSDAGEVGVDAIADPAFFVAAFGPNADARRAGSGRAQTFRARAGQGKKRWTQDGPGRLKERHADQTAH